MRSGAWALVFFAPLVGAACGSGNGASSDAFGGEDASVAGFSDAASSDATRAGDRDAASHVESDPDAALGDDEAADAALTDSSATNRGLLVAYVGGYAGAITRYSVDETSGALTQTATTTSFGASPSFLAIDPAATHLYAVDEATTGRVGAYGIDPSGALTFLASVSSGGSGPAYVGLDRTAHYVFVANYDDGNVSILPIAGDGTLGAATDSQMAGSNAHMMIADLTNRYVFVPCKGADYVAQYVFDAAAGTLAPNPVAATFATATGAGPRHLAFHPNGKFAYLVSETASTLTALSLDASSGTLTAIETASTLTGSTIDAGATTGAEVWVHPTGNWVLASNRGDDSLAVFAVDPSSGKMTFHGRTKSGGATPRSFAIGPSGAFVAAANEGGNNVVPFAFDSATGALSPGSGNDLGVASPSFVGFARLPAP